MYLKLCPISELPQEESFKGYELNEIPILVVHQNDVQCFLDQCSHQDIKLSEFGAFQDGEIICYAHGARFCPKTGKGLCHPASQPLKSIPAKLEQGFLWVDLGSFLCQS